MIQQLLERRNEMQCMRQRRVTLKRLHIPPPAVNVELVRIPYGTESAIVETTGLLAGRPLYLKHGVVHLALLAGEGVEPGEYKYLHVGLV
jgi:hypothetical protein